MVLPMPKFIALLTQGRMAVFVTTFLLTLLLFVLRGVGLLTFLPGGIFLILFMISYGLFLLALNPQRKVW